MNRYMCIMKPVYVMPLVPYNLTKNETVIQLAEVVDHLSKVAESLLDSINQKVEKGSRTLSDITERINTCHLKINKLNGAKKATQVFASSKYPASEVNRNYVSIFADVKFPKIERHKVRHSSFVLNDEPLEKLHVYHVKRETEEKRDITGLGDMPNDLNYVNDALLYNSGKNLYKEFVMSDTLNITREVREQETAEASGLEPAPYSIRERASFTPSSTESYFYSPDLGDVPSLDVPLDLPDLPGIADDLRYDIEEGPGIAPSVGSTPLLPDLPSIESLSSYNQQDISYILPDLPSIDSVSPPDQEEVQLPLPPPPPVAPPVIVDVSKDQLKAREETQEQIRKKGDTAMAHSEQEISEQHGLLEEGIPSTSSPISKTRGVSKEILEPIDMHSSLMDAIRKAGGAKNAKLKSVDKEKEETKKPKSGGDLMADLHAKLSMRRKGISGTKNEGDLSDSSSVMDRVSALIPPPPPRSETTGTGSDITATEDDDEWSRGYMLKDLRMKLSMRRRGLLGVRCDEELSDTGSDSVSDIPRPPLSRDSISTDSTTTTTDDGEWV